MQVRVKVYIFVLSLINNIKIRHMNYYLVTITSEKGTEVNIKCQGTDRYNAMMYAELNAQENGVNVNPSKTKAKEISVAEYIK